MDTYVQEQLAQPPLSITDRNLQVSLVSLIAVRYPQEIDRYNYNKFDCHEVNNFVHFDLIPFLPALQGKQYSISRKWNIITFIKKHKHKLRQFIFHIEQPVFTYQLKESRNSINLGLQLYHQKGLNALL